MPDATPGPGFRLRRATAADSELLAALGRETFADSFGADNTPADMAAYLAGAFGPAIQGAELAVPGSWFLILEADAEPVGYARVRRVTPPEEVPGRRPMEIVRFYARKPWIGKGVGSRLMQCCLQEAADEGCDSVWLAVWEENARAIAFYERWGFRRVGVKDFLLGADLQHDLVMARMIEDAPG